MVIKYTSKKDKSKANWYKRHKLLFDSIRRDDLCNFLVYKLPLLKRDMNIKNSEGYTPLYEAVKFSSIEFVRYLLHNEADPNLKCRNGDNPVHLAFK